MPLSLAEPRLPSRHLDEPRVAQTTLRYNIGRNKCGRRFHCLPFFAPIVIPVVGQIEWPPGAGPHLAPRLLAAFGEQRERFTSADELQKYSSTAPVTERSGKKRWVHWRWQCPTFVRQTFVEWAAQTINLTVLVNSMYYPPIFNCFVKEPRRWGLRPSDLSNTCR